MFISTKFFKLEEENISGVIPDYNARNKLHMSRIGPIIKYSATLMGYLLNVLNIVRMLLTGKWLLFSNQEGMVLENKYFRISLFLRPHRKFFLCFRLFE